MFDSKYERGIHQYEPRYNYASLPAGKTLEANGDVARELEILSRRDYVLDICVKCGKTINHKE